ncbi:MAG: hypothetical protein CL526_12610 [Aequorivita sp.]|nr:hypothetical protein [Aequorivita sp.]
MQTSKIAQLRENVRTWTSPDGTKFFVHNVQLENGVQGSAFGKSESAPYQIGDEIQYEEKRTNDGTRLKIRKAGQYNAGGYGSRPANPEKEMRIMRQSAMKIAAQMVGAGQHFSNYVNAAEECIKYFQNGAQYSTPPVPNQHQPQIETRTPTHTTTSTDEIPF